MFEGKKGFPLLSLTQLRETGMVSTYIQAYIIHSRVRRYIMLNRVS